MSPTRLLVGTREGILALDLKDGGWSKGSVLWRGKAVSGIAVDPAAPERIHAAVYDDGIYRSEDGGRTWERYLWAESHALAVQPRRPELVFAGAEPAAVYRSTDRGSFWSPARITRGPARVAAARDEWTRVRALAFHPSDDEMAYAGIEGGGILVSYDGGSEWNELAARGIDGNVQALCVLADPPTTVFAGTDRGVFQSADGGYYWTRSDAGLDLPNVLALTELGPTLLAAGHLDTAADWWDPIPSRIFRLAAGSARWWPASEVLDGAVYGFASAGGAVFAGTTGGSILLGLDDGAEWQVFARGLPPIRAIALA